MYFIEWQTPLLNRRYAPNMFSYFLLRTGLLQRCNRLDPTAPFLNSSIGSTGMVLLDCSIPALWNWIHRKSRTERLGKKKTTEKERKKNRKTTKKQWKNKRKTTKINGKTTEKQRKNNEKKTTKKQWKNNEKSESKCVDLHCNPIISQDSM